jgi:hypothetical protein
MFEKEAEDSFNGKKVLYKSSTDKCSYIDGFKDGYNKANEWHYVKDGLPEELHDVLCFVIHNEHRYVLQGYLRDGRWVLSPLGTYLNNEDVIAWKEIVLPKEIE